MVSRSEDEKRVRGLWFEVRRCMAVLPFPTRHSILDYTFCDVQLQKRSPVLGQWKRRYFVVDCVRGALVYYADDECSIFKGAIPPTAAHHEGHSERRPMYRHRYPRTIIRVAASA